MSREQVAKDYEEYKGKGRIWGTVAGAVVLELIANLMVLSDLVSEYLVGAVQGAIIIVAMLIQRFSK